MVKYAYDFLELDEGIPKPRKTGLTFVRDPGMGLKEQELYLESSAQFLDYAKFRNVTPRLFPEELILEKIKLYNKFDVNVMSGGMFFQFSWLQLRLYRGSRLFGGGSEFRPDGYSARRCSAFHRAVERTGP